MYYFEIKFIKYIFKRLQVGEKYSKKNVCESENSHFEKVIAAVFFVCLFAKIITWKASCRVNV